VLGNIDGLVLTDVPRVSVFTFYTVLSLGGSKGIEREHTNTRNISTPRVRAQCM